MKICIAQTRPVIGNIQNNIEDHLRFINLASAEGAEMIIFPELSLTGYNSGLAKVLAAEVNDERFDVFQKISDSSGIIIAAGMPVKSKGGINIGLLVFQPGKARSLYSKKYLYADELPYFTSGESTPGLLGGENAVALAICYEISVPEHAENAFNSGAKVYLASVAKTAEGLKKSGLALPELARKYSMSILMSNCIGPCDNAQCAGGSAVWNNKGELLAQLDDSAEGFLIFDTETEEVNEKSILKMNS